MAAVIVSSHLLPDVEYTCDHVIVMDKGRVAAEGPIAALKQPRGQVFLGGRGRLAHVDLRVANSDKAKAGEFRWTRDQLGNGAISRSFPNHQRTDAAAGG